jgi:hypothetical protein
MSAEHTNVEKQVRQHAAPLSGMAILVALVFAGFLVWLGWVFFQGQDPGENTMPNAEITAPAEPAPETAPMTEPAPAPSE